MKVSAYHVEKLNKQRIVNFSLYILLCYLALSVPSGLLFSFYSELWLCNDSYEEDAGRHASEVDALTWNCCVVEEVTLFNLKIEGGKISHLMRIVKVNRVRDVS
jgi:hypothetical protein